MSIAKDSQLTNCSRVCEANYLTIFRTKQDLTAKGEENCLGRIVKRVGKARGDYIEFSQANLIP